MCMRLITTQEHFCPGGEKTVRVLAELQHKTIVCLGGEIAVRRQYVYALNYNTRQFVVCVVR